MGQCPSQPYKETSGLSGLKGDILISPRLGEVRRHKDQDKGGPVSAAPQSEPTRWVPESRLHLGSPGKERKLGASLWNRTWANYLFSIRSEPSLPNCTMGLGIPAVKGDRLQAVRGLGHCQERGSQKSSYRDRES